MSASFKGIRGNDRVYFWQYAGLGLNGPEYKKASGKANLLLLFPDHVVVNVGSRAQVVNSENYISHKRTKDSGSEPSDMIKFI